MKNKLSLFASLLVLSIGVFACENPETDTIQEQKEVVEEVTKEPTYDRNLGAHVVAPELTEILQDKHGVVMYMLTMEPGDTLPWHEHPPHTFYIVEGGTLEVIFENGSHTSHYTEGQTNFGSSFGDMAINTGGTTLKVLMHEFYSLGD